MISLKGHKPQLIYVLIAVAVLVGGYLLGRLHSHKMGKDLLYEMEELRAKESDAAVVKRVSQQMEAIAYQQKAISDKQRDRAEEQSQLALDMRDRAEMESQIARQAESRAVQLARQAENSAKEAEEQRTIALENQKEAEIKRDEATYAKSVSDTLNYRSLARALGNSVMVQYDGGNLEVAGMLAYVSWYFLDRYRGNTYQSEVFKALSMCSETQKTYTMMRRGGVTAISSLPDGGFVAVSDFGEIEKRDADGGNPVQIYHDSSYDFRDVHVYQGYIYALSLHGPLCIIDPDGRVTTVELPQDSYIKLLPLEDNMLLIAGKQNCCRYDKTLHQLISQIGLDHDLTAVAAYKDKAQLFFSDGTCACLGRDFQITPMESPADKVVTAAIYDENSGTIYLGCNNGDIVVIRKDGSRSVLYGHVSQILSLAYVNGLLISGSYDRSTMIWNLRKIRGMDGDDSEHNDESAITEWLTPVDYSFGGWPMSVCRVGESEVLVGSSNGQIVHIEVSDRKMASKIINGLPRNFTEEEWNTYVGSSIPYEKLK